MSTNPRPTTARAKGIAAKQLKNYKEKKFCDLIVTALGKWKQFHSHNKTIELLFSVETNFSKGNYSI